MTPQDFLFRGALDELDPDVAELIRHETARQARYLIMIPSESSVPEAVRSALSSAFHNIYAEGYPLDETRSMTQAEILDYEARLPEYRRIGDNRYYKGTEYADVVEALARRRVAECFATSKYTAEKLFVNVQPLSGAPANSAVYTGLLTVGDTIMGMDLLHGGHLTHGSPVARSGKQYKIVSYGIHPETERIDYEQMARLAQEHRPKIIIGGYSSYPWAPDWKRFREIADAVGALLMADVAHVAGLIVGGVYPSPVGIADVITFTTHKTLHGPRGAVIITHRGDLASKLDRGVFPGEQGGPHVHQIAALAVAMRLAATEQFRSLQARIVANAQRLAHKLTARGLKLAYGGTDTHMFALDCKSIVGPDGTPLSGDMAARILDLVGIVCNRQTIPGDTSALRPSGIRLGTPWISQRGFGDAEIDRLGDLIADVLTACVPFSYTGKKRAEARAKIDFETMQRVKSGVRDLAASVGIDTDAAADDYPHFYYMDGEVEGWHTLAVRGANAELFLQMALTCNVRCVPAHGQEPTYILNADGSVITHGLVERQDGGYLLHVAKNARRVAAWLRALSDGFALFDHDDIYAKLPGPVTVCMVGQTDVNHLAQNGQAEWREEGMGYGAKTYFIGMNGAHYTGPRHDALPVFAWQESESAALLTTPLHSLHKEMGAKMVGFAGYDMPVWYTSVTEEHLATRKNAGLFDVTHMGVFDAQGTGAADFLHVVTTNDVQNLAVGDSHYTYFLDVNGIPIDDLMIYRLAHEHFLIVVNASNNDKNWAWLNEVKNHRVTIDPAVPGRRIECADRFVLRDLRDPASGADRRVDVALQGPKSREMLLSLEGSDADKAKIKALGWANVTHVHLGGFDLIVSRTGYTGERVAFELFVHPDRAADLFRALVRAGATPCGLAARDSLRTEAGLPLYGHELAGALSLNPADAGFSAYVKLSKPFFVGKAAFLRHEHKREAEIVRFRLDNKGVRPPHQGDVLVDKRGRVVGIVTSCSIDSEGYQLGQAYVKDEFTAEGTPLAVFAGASHSKAGKADAKLGDKLTLPDPVTVLSRFPKAKKG
ncbi:MAG: glycine cleavage system aminomethyltransferase GcvT [Chloroflexi bacterium]|nr:glycine cleavage system aminomethyltransferase GcvT [Chloroflexota bacterium]